MGDLAVSGAAADYLVIPSAGPAVPLLECVGPDCIAVLFDDGPESIAVCAGHRAGAVT